MRRSTLYIVLALVALLVIAGSAAAFVAVQASPSAVLSAPISAPTLTPSSGETLFRIIPAESQARFLIDETYFGTRHTVIGSTDQVAGDILMNTGNPAKSQLGVIRINARALTTDNFFRDAVLRQRILLTDRPEYEFLEFMPESFEGLPETVSVGESYSFQTTGVLTVRDRPLTLTFDARVDMISDDRLFGTASVAVSLTDVGIGIPRAPGVEAVSDNVRLELDFTAEAVND